MSLIALMALPAVIVGGTVAFFTWNAQRAARALLLSELLLALVAMAVLPAHGAEKGNWINPVGHTRLIYDGVKAGRTYDDALKDTQPIIQRELEADNVGERIGTIPRARARTRRVVPISELVFGVLTQNRSSFEPSIEFAAIARHAAH